MGAPIVLWHKHACGTPNSVLRPALVLAVALSMGSVHKTGEDAVVHPLYVLPILCGTSNY